MGLLRPVEISGLLGASRDALAAVLAASTLRIPWLHRDASSIMQAVLHNMSMELVSVL
jgi:hypothetical protein